MRRGEEIEAIDVSSGNNADLAMVAGQERQRGLRERERERERERLRLKKNEKGASAVVRSID